MKKQAGEGHSQTGKHRGRDKLREKKRASKQGALTCWRAQREGHVRTPKDRK